MGEVIQFPSGSTLEWAGIESDLRRAYSDRPEMAQAFERALPEIRRHFESLYPAFTVSFQLPPLSEEDARKVLQATDAAFAQLHANLKAERAASFAQIVAFEVRIEWLLAQQP